MVLRLSKMEAATRLDVSASTIDRMIQRGELQVEREPHGSRHRIWVLVDGEEAEGSDKSSGESSEVSTKGAVDTSGGITSDEGDVSVEVELAVLKERVKSLEELADYHRGLLKDSEWRYQQAVEQLGTSQRTMETLTRALPSTDQSHHAAPRRSWWPFGRNQH